MQTIAIRRKSHIFLYFNRSLSKELTILILSLYFLFQHAFLKQFYGSVTKSDYTTMRHYFIMVRNYFSGLVSVKFSTYLYILFLTFNCLFFMRPNCFLADTLHGESKVWFSQIYGASTWIWFWESCRSQVHLSRILSAT